MASRSAGEHQFDVSGLRHDSACRGLQPAVHQGILERRRVIRGDGRISQQCLFKFTRGWAYQSYTGGIDIHKASIGSCATTCSGTSAPRRARRESLSMPSTSELVLLFHPPAEHRGGTQRRGELLTVASVSA